MTRLYFCGIKHSGKTTFAKRIAERTGLDCIDADDLMTQTLNGKTVREYYREFGKKAFMDLECRTARAFIESREASFILSLGGGASDNAELMDTLKKTGTVIYLARDEKEMLPVILKHGIPSFLDENDVEGSFHALYERRDALYRKQADYTIELGPYRDKDDTAEMLYTILKEKYHVI